MAMKNLYNRYTNYYKTIFVLFFIMTLGGMTGLAQAIVEPFTPRTSSSTPNRTIYSIKGDFTMIGNTNMSINPDPDASNDNNDNNGQTNPSYYVDVDSDPTTLNSSRAELVLYEDQDVDPACSEIVFAGLYWTGRAHDGGSSPVEFQVNVGSSGNPDYRTLNKRKVKIKGPGASGYTEIMADQDDIYYPVTAHGQMYSGFAEVTDYVRSHGAGEYTVADIALREGAGGGTGYYGGWSMVVVYENSQMAWKDISIFDGHAYVVGSTTISHTLPVSGFHAVQDGPVKVKVGMMAGEGDRGISGDYFDMQRQDNNNWQRLSHSGNSTSNFFNSSIITEGGRYPNYVNNSGLDIAMFELPNEDKRFITNGQTSTTFRYGTTQDTYIIPLIVIGIDAYIPEPEGVEQVVTVNGHPNGEIVFPGDEIEVKVDIRNIGSEDIIDGRVEVPIPFGAEYVEGSVAGSYAGFDLPSGTSDPTPYFDASAGGNGKIIWEFGDMPLEDGDPVLGTLTYKIKVTEDCALLANTNCDLFIVLSGGISGKGAISGVEFDINDHPFIQGYEVDGSCEGRPITELIRMQIDAEDFVNAECENYDPSFHFAFCYDGNDVLVNAIRSSFPAGTRFYNGTDRETATEYTNSNPFPGDEGERTYYAFLPISVDCYYEFTIDITNVTTTPTAHNVEYCVEDAAEPLTATLSSTGQNEGYNLYYFTSETGGNPQNSITPSTSTAGTMDYWVAEVPSANCIGDRVKITVTVHELPAPPVSSGDLTDCAPANLNANDAVTIASATTIVWYNAATGGDVGSSRDLSEVV